MLELLPDAAAWALVMAGALIAGFTTGFAGFGTGLVASGFWFYALPAHAVPPLVAFASVAAQIVRSIVRSVSETAKINPAPIRLCAAGWRFT